MARAKQAALPNSAAYPYPTAAMFATHAQLSQPSGARPEADGAHLGISLASAALSNTCSTVLAVASYNQTSNLPSMRRRQSEHACEGTGGASVDTQTDRARRVLRCTRTPFDGALGARECRDWPRGRACWRGAGVPALLLYVLEQGENTGRQGG